MKPIKVLMVGSSQKVKGGITSVISQLLSVEWDNYDVKMSFVPTFIDGNNLKKVLYYIYSYLKIVIILFSQSPNIVHIHMSHNGSFHRKYYILKLCKLFRKKTIIHLHSSEFVDFYEKSNQTNKDKIHWFLKSCNYIFVLGNEWEKRILEIEPEAKTVILNNTVKIPAYVEKNINEEIKITFLGVLVERKGVGDLIEAVNLLKKEGLFSSHNVKFEIGGVGPLESQLKSTVNQCELNSYFNFLGWIEGHSKTELLKKSDIFVLPSYNEGLPISILEAISYALPVISTNVGSIEEAVIENENGNLFEPGNISQLKLLLEKLIKDSQLRKSYSQYSRKLAESKFSDEKYYNTISEVYNCLSK